MGKYYPKIYCSMTTDALSIFGAKPKIALTGVRSRVWESSQNVYLILITMYFSLGTYLFPCKKVIPTI